MGRGDPPPPVEATALERTIARRIIRGDRRTRELSAIGHMPLETLDERHYLVALGETVQHFRRV
eukprot:4972575-Alexandrium_andersonii.AAC.1